MQALEIDHLVEEFYQRLMICYHRMDRNADAVLVFRRCLKNFEKALRISPSTQTRALYKNLLAKEYASQGKNESTEKKFKYVNNL
jgi:DNA-binding SARP family transcriptional activator